MSTPAFAIAAVALVMSGTATGQSAEPAATLFRPLGSFAYLHVPVASGDAGKLNREFRKQIAPPDNHTRWMPFGWKLLDSVPSPDAPEVLIASVRSHPSVHAGVIVDLSDARGRTIATIEGKPAPLRRTATMSLINVVDTLRQLAFETQKADRLIASFSTLRLRLAAKRSASYPIDAAEADALKNRLAQRLREKGSWTVVDGNPRADSGTEVDVLDCSLEILNSTPSIVRLQCQDSSERHVAAVGGSNCRSCWGELQFSPGGDTKRAIDGVVEALLDHRARVDRIYSPQLRSSR